MTIGEAWERLSGSPLATRLSILLLAVSLACGVVLRIVALDEAPPGLQHDEACNGYDAYCIATTARDHHGNLLPILVQGFNDYRSPLIDYSLVPLVGAFGLKPAVVRLGPAIWGIAEMAAITVLAGSTLGLPGAAVAAMLVATSPWHLSISRFALDYITASATVSLAMACFFLWLGGWRRRWLLLSGIFFGVSLNSYAITKSFVPLIIGWMALMYWRELRRSGGAAIAALGIVLLLVLPQAVVLMTQPQKLLGPVQRFSIFHYIANCPDCAPAQIKAARFSFPALVEDAGASFVSYFTPSFLFLNGDRGDHWTLLHPPGFGELLPEQALLIGLAMLALLSGRRRKFAIFLIGWILLAAVPGTFAVPPGALLPDAGPVRAAVSPWPFTDQALRNVPLTPGLLLAHPCARRDVLAIAPWIVLSALGLVVLMEMLEGAPLVRSAAVALLVGAIAFSAARFVESYFRDYPTIAAPYFDYGMDEVVRAIAKFDDGNEPIVISNRMIMPYIFVLFYGHYPPKLFQSEQVAYAQGFSPPPVNLHAPVVAFGRYAFVNPRWAYRRVPGHGIFVFAAGETPPVDPKVIVRYPDGQVAYSVVVK